MFEKEAEEIANKRCHEIMCFGHCSFSSPKHHRCGEWHREYNCAKEGIEYGYNKANEWHYVKDELPKDNEYVLIYTDLNNCYVAKKVENHFMSKGWGFIPMSTVIAWKEIVLPKESE